MAYFENKLKHELTDICKVCGEDFGCHAAKDDACPVLDDIQPSRKIGYYEDKFFHMWEE